MFIFYISAMIIITGYIFNGTEPMKIKHIRAVLETSFTTSIFFVILDLIHIPYKSNTIAFGLMSFIGFASVVYIFNLLTTFLYIYNKLIFYTLKRNPKFNIWYERNKEKRIGGVNER